MGVLGGVFVLKSGLRILIRAPEVPFSVPPKTPKMGVFGYFGGKVIFGHFTYFGHFPIEIPIEAENTITMGRSWATEETKYVLRPVKQWEQLGNMHNLISKTFLNKNPPTGQCWSPGRQMFNHCKIRSKCEHTSDTSHSSLQCIGVEKNLFGVKSGEMHQAENGGGARPWVFALWCSLPQRLISLSLKLWAIVLIIVVSTSTCELQRGNAQARSHPFSSFQSFDDRSPRSWMVEN